MMVDRLSSLPDDLLIGIISRLPFQLAITTGTLSRRWRCLWSNTTSIDMTLRKDITLRKTSNLSKLDNPLNNTLRQLTSPFIHTFNIEFVEPYSNVDFWTPCMAIIIRDVCNRNVRQLKVTWRNPSAWDYYHNRYTFSRVIFQTQSLVSIELGSKSGSYFRKDWGFNDDCDTINLPNLKNLTIHFASQDQWIEKLVKACPSLERLSLNCWLINLFDFQCSQSWTIVINAPNLEYLSVMAPKIMIISFEGEKPIMLHETKIEFTHLHLPQSDKYKLSKFYAAISNLRFLTFDICAVDALSTVFRNVTRLNFNMKLSLCSKTLLSVLDMFPAVDVLTLKFCGDDYYGNKEKLLYGKPVNVSTSRQAIRRIKTINVEINNRRTQFNSAKCFSRLIMGLVRSTCDLEHFNLSVNDDFVQEWQSSNVMGNQDHELNLCEKIYHCQTISTCCDVEFKGRFLKMSRKDGPKITTADGKVIYFLRSRKMIIPKEQ